MKLRLDIEPVGKGRPRAVCYGDSVRMHTPKRTRHYERAIALAAKRHKPPGKLQGALRVRIVAIFDRPAYMRKRSKRDGTLLGGYPEGRLAHYQTPDADNVAKAVLDALSDWWGDDRQIAELTVHKAWRAMDEEPGLEIEILEIGEVAA